MSSFYKAKVGLLPKLLMDLKSPGKRGKKAFN
jgi:hypothetical protein